MDVFSILLPLAQVRRRFEIQDPWISLEAFWWIGAASFGLWMFAIGGSIGSFLNVVVYRLPAGINLSSPGSRCPRCLSSIRLRHNIPVFGWLLLRGRCYDCHLPISARYPLVEALVATLFLVVGCAFFIGNGSILPVPPGGMGRLPLNVDQPGVLGAALAMHLALLTTLIGAALIDYDRQPIPPSLFLPGMAFALVASLIAPAVHPVPAFDPFFWEWKSVFKPAWQQGLLDVVAGALGGLIATAIIYVSAWVRPWFGQRYAGPVALCWMLIGMVFGWQMIPFFLLGWAITLAVARTDERTIASRPALEVSSLAVVLFCTLLGWRSLANYPLLLEPGPAFEALVMLAMLLSSALCIHLAARGWPAELPPPPAPPEIVTLMATDPPLDSTTDPDIDLASAEEPTSPDLRDTP